MVWSQALPNHSGIRNIDDFRVITEQGVLKLYAHLEDHRPQVKGPYFQVIHAGSFDWPDLDSVAFDLRNCGSRKKLSAGKKLHAQIVSHEYQGDRFLGNLLVEMYGKCGSLEDARQVFEKMGERNVFSWSIVISVYVQHMPGKEAFLLFRAMPESGIDPNKITFITMLNACNCHADVVDGKVIHAQIIEYGFQKDIVVSTALVSMYGRCCGLEYGEGVFNQMPRRNVVSWNAMIAACVHNGHCEKALHYSQQMHKDGVVPDEATYVTLLEACTKLSALAEGRDLHARIVYSGLESSMLVANALVDMYGKSGSIQDARRVFAKMHRRDVISWNAMLATYAWHGQGTQVLSLFRYMQQEGVVPDKVSLLGILSACSRQGLQPQCLHCFTCMRQVYRITHTLEHYGCVVDLLGRAGLLDEAEDLINSISCSLSAMVWIILLAACRNHGELQRGKRAAECACLLDSSSIVPYVLLANLYSLCSMWEDAAKLKKVMQEKCTKQLSSPGLQVGYWMHRFLDDWV